MTGSAAPVALALSMLWATGCSEDSRPVRPRLAPPPVAASSPWSNEDPIPNCCAPEARDVLVLNRTGAPIELDVTYGPGSFLALAEELGQHGSLTVNQSRDVCRCPCEAGSRCIICEAPRPEAITIAPGGEHHYAWDGRARRLRLNEHGETCFDTYDPPEGRYVLSACGQGGGGCATATVDVPASTRVELVLDGTPRRAAACRPGDVMPRRAASFALFQMHRAGVAQDRILRCDPTQVRCVDDAAQADSATGACALFVIPSGDELEARVLLPAAGGQPAVRFSAFLDPDGVSVRRVQHGE